MSKMLYNINWTGEEPTLSEVAEKFGFDKKDLDDEYGVIAIDPDQNLYSILVEESAVVPSDEKSGIEGPFSNPKIEPFNLEE